jgi:HAD superfamily hydrolase (TIGR01484 family)
MDGTLVPSRQAMPLHFAEKLVKLVNGFHFYVATGSDLCKVKEQIPREVIDNISGIYTSMGNEFYVHGERIYKNRITPDEILLNDLLNYRSDTTYPHELYENFIEIRSGMINFSVLGRDCPFEAREKYQIWDGLNKEREKIVSELSVKYPAYRFLIGGVISIDIVPNGFGKDQIADKVRTLHPHEQIVFFGDMTEEGGNDYDLAQKLLKFGNTEIVTIRTPDEVLTYLSNLTGMEVM